MEQSVEVQRAVELALLKQEVKNLREDLTQLTASVAALTEQVTLLVQAQTGAKWIVGLVSFALPIASLVIALLAYLAKAKGAA